jgi:hypothetical protein
VRSTDRAGLFSVFGIKNKGAEDDQEREGGEKEKNQKHLSAVMSPAEWRHDCLELVKIQQLL